jgi:hypothetical protein
MKTKLFLLVLASVVLSGCGLFKNPMGENNANPVICTYTVSSVAPNNPKLILSINYGDANGKLVQTSGINTWTFSQELKPQSDGTYKAYLSAMPVCPVPMDVKTDAAQAFVHAEVNGQILFDNAGVYGYNIAVEGNFTFKFENGKVIK